jgi:hypothetical protein
VVHLWVYSVPIGGLSLKLRILYFSPPFCPIFGPFCQFQRLYNLSTPRKVHFLHCFVCTTIFYVHLWIYSVPNCKLASKLKILYFGPLFCPQFGPFCIIQSLCNPSTPSKVHVLHCFVCTTIFFSPFMDLQCCKWQIGLKIEDFVFLTSGLPKFGPFCAFLSLHILFMPCKV